MVLIDILSSTDQRNQISLLGILRTRLALWRSRRALARLNDRELADIGVSREAAKREAAKGAWDVPPSWLER
ncbi:MAG: DUF1127 domain-containing protein [Pseudomonadota bacterium]